MNRSDGLTQTGMSESSQLLVTTAALALLAGLFMAPDPVSAQEDVSADLFAGATAPVGGLAEVTTRLPAIHYGLGLSVPVSGAWGLRAEASLHEFSERRFRAASGGGSGGHLQLWQFFLLAERGVASAGDLRVRVRGGAGVTHLNSDLSTRLRFRALRTPQPRFSGAQPAARVGAEAGYRVGPGDLFLEAGAIVTGLPGSETDFYGAASGGEVGALDILVSLPVSAGIRLRF